MKYYLNPKSGTLHIEGYCRFTRPVPKEYLEFDSEEEADRIFTRRCKSCQKKKEEVLRKIEKL